MELKDLVHPKFAEDVEPELFKIMTGLESPPLSVPQICSLVASTPDGIPLAFGSPDALYMSVLAAVYQDDDAHDTCTLTACLNPLHPGPCKGWKGTLHEVSPGAWKALESARVEKANHTRIKKIEALKAQGKPIPHKLLQPIVAKQHPNAGKTAASATGEAHAAGKAISDASGVHVNEPGKVTLGQAVKQIVPTDATAEKGAKGKKPTVASKGIAHVIAQEKVTPQYKLDKADKITPEQWAALSHDEKAIVRGELVKIQKDGFGPQQKKATELLAKLNEPKAEAPKASPIGVPTSAEAQAQIDKQVGNGPKAAEPLAPGTPGTITTPSGKVYQKVTLKNAAEPEAKPETPAAPTAPATTKGEKHVYTVVHDGETITRTSTADYTHASLVQKGHDGPVVVWGFHKSEKNALGTPLTSMQKKNGFKVVGALPVTKEPLKKKSTKQEPKLGELTPGAPGTITTPSGKTYQKVALKEPSSGDQVAAVVAISDAIPGIKAISEGGDTKLTAAFDKLKGGGKLEDALPFKAAVNALAQKALKVATEDGMPGLGHGTGDIGIPEFNHEIRDHILAGKPGLPPLVQKMLDHHASVKAKEEHENKAVADLIKAHEANPPKVKNATAAVGMTPSGLAKQIQKHGPVKVTINGVTHKVGFEGTGDHAELVQVTGIGPGTGHYVIKTPGGEKIQLGKGEQITVHAPEAGAKLGGPKPPEALKAVEKPKDLPKHVQHAIDMANGHAPGASWSKNHLLAYAPLTAEEFHALPGDTQDKILQDLNKATEKLLDPKKIQAVKDTLEKFKGSSKVSAPAKDVSFTHDLHDHSISAAQAKTAADQADTATLWNAVKSVTGLHEGNNPDSPAHDTHATTTAKHLSDMLLESYDAAVTSDPQAKEAVKEFRNTITGYMHTQAVSEAKKKAFNAIGMKLATDSKDLSPLEKAALQKYQSYLLAHHVKTDQPHLGEQLNDATKAKIVLTGKLDAVKKKHEAPAPSSMSPAQIGSEAEKLLGSEAVLPNVNLKMAEAKAAFAVGKEQADAEAAKYPAAIMTNPTVLAKHNSLVQDAGQLAATKASQSKLIAHIAEHHTAVVKSGHAPDGTPLTAHDKDVIQAHKTLLYQSHGYLNTVEEQQKEKVAKSTAQFHLAAQNAEDLIPANVPAVTLSDFDKGAIEEAYSNAWGKHASKAVLYGVKGWTQKQQMKEHADYAPLTQDLGNLKALSGRVALAHARLHTASLNVPTDPETGDKLPGPEKDAWLAAAVDVVDVQQEFDKVHKLAQARLDTIRTDVGLKKRALPKADNAAVKTAAAESGYYKSGGYGGPNYGKSHTAKHYMLAKVGPKHAVAHQSASEKKAATLAKLVESAPPTPVVKAPTSALPKSAIPSASVAGTTPTKAAAEAHGFKYVDSVDNTTHDWSYGKGPAYIADEAHFKELQEHLAKPDTQFGIGAQKKFQWSIGNMQGKGASSAQHGSLHSYTGSGYTSVNSKLNSLPPGAKKTGSTSVANIDAAMAASPPMEGDVVLYRGFSNPKGVFGSSGKWNDVNVAGMEWSQRSYSSTSGSLSTSASFAGSHGVVMRIIIPKEMQVKGINAKGGQHTSENEIILQRGLRYRVVADYGTHGSYNQRFIDVMVVPNPYDKAE